MGIYFSELCLLGGNVFSNVDRMAAAGAKNIELMLDGPGWDRFDLRADSLVKGLLARPVTYSVHTPVWDTNLTSENYFVRRGAMESVRRAIVLAAGLRAKHVVVHPGFCMSGCFSRETAQKRAAEAVNELADFNRDYGMRLLFENVGGSATSLFTQEEFVRFSSGLPSGAGCLVDIGHAHWNGWDIPRLISEVGSRLFAVHLHDNDGTGDQHLPMRRGTVDWEPVFSALRSAPRDVSLVLEYGTGTPLAVLARDAAALERSVSGAKP